MFANLSSWAPALEEYKSYEWVKLSSDEFMTTSGGHQIDNPLIGQTVLVISLDNIYADIGHTYTVWSNKNRELSKLCGKFITNRIEERYIQELLFEEKTKIMSDMAMSEVFTAPEPKVEEVPKEEIKEEPVATNTWQGVDITYF